MPRFYLRLTLIPIALFTVVLLVIPALPYNNAELRQFLLPEGCPVPCLMGIRLGITTMDEAVAILKANPWVDHVEKETGYFSERIIWTWNDRIPKQIIPTSHGQLSPTENSEKPLVDTINISSVLQLGEVYAVLGSPNTETLTNTGYSIGERYAYIDYMALYAQQKLFLFLEQACLTGYMTTGHGESVGMAFTTPIDIVIGNGITLPISAWPIPARSPIHLRPACGS